MPLNMNGLGGVDFGAPQGKKIKFKGFENIDFGVTPGEASYLKQISQWDAADLQKKQQEQQRQQQQSQPKNLTDMMSKMNPLLSPEYRTAAAAYVKTPEFTNQYNAQPATPSLRQDIASIGNLPRDVFKKVTNINNLGNEAAFIQNKIKNRDLGGLLKEASVINRNVAVKAPGYINQFAETANQNLFGGLGRGLVDVGNFAGKIDPFSYGANMATKGGYYAKRDETAKNLKNTFFPEQGTKNSLSTTKREDLGFAGKAGQLYGSIAKEIAINVPTMIAGGELANVFSKGATTFLGGLTTKAPNLINLTDKVIKGAVNNGSFVLINDLMSGKGAKESLSNSAKWAALGGIGGPATELIPMVGNTPIIQKVPRALGGATGNALLAKALGMNPVDGAFLGLLHGFTTPKEGLKLVKDVTIDRQTFKNADAKKILDSMSGKLSNDRMTPESQSQLNRLIEAVNRGEDITIKRPPTIEKTLWGKMVDTLTSKKTKWTISDVAPEEMSSAVRAIAPPAETPGIASPLVQAPDIAKTPSPMVNIGVNPAVDVMPAPQPTTIQKAVPIAPAPSQPVPIVPKLVAPAKSSVKFRRLVASPISQDKAVLEANKKTPGKYGKENLTRAQAVTDAGALEEAHKLIRAYVNRGDTVQQLKAGQEGVSSNGISADIGGFLDGKSNSNNIIVKLDDGRIYKYSLKAIYDSVKSETKTIIKRPIAPKAPQVGKTKAIPKVVAKTPGKVAPIRKTTAATKALKPLEDLAMHLHNKPADKITPAQLRNIMASPEFKISTADGGGGVVAGKEYVQKFGNRNKAIAYGDREELSYGSLENGYFTDSYIAVLDKKMINDIDKKVTDIQIKKQIKYYNKESKFDSMSLAEKTAQAKQDVMEARKGSGDRAPSLETLGNVANIKTKAGTVAKLTGYYKNVAVLSDGKTDVTIDANKLALFDKYFPDATYRIGTAKDTKSPSLDPVQIISKNKIVGVIMPMRESDKIPANLRSEGAKGDLEKPSFQRQSIDRTTSGAISRLITLDESMPEPKNTQRYYQWAKKDNDTQWVFDNPDSLAKFINGRVVKGDRLSFIDVPSSKIVNLGEERAKNGIYQIDGEFTSTGSVQVGIKKEPYAYETPSFQKETVVSNGLTTSVLEKLKGKEVLSRQEVSNLSRSGDVKPAEKEVIDKVLRDLPAGEKFSYKDFSNAVKTELLPLKVNTMADSSIGIIKETDDVAKSIRDATGLSPDEVLNRMAPYKGKPEKFSKQVTKDATRWQELTDIQEVDSDFSMDETRYREVTLKPELRGNVQAYNEKIYESDIKTQAGAIHFGGLTDNYFAHVRDELMPNKLRRIIEIQSDLFQKGRLDTEDFGMRIDRNLAGTPEYRKQVDAQDIAKEQARTKLQPYKNNWYQRLVREEIKSAATDGIKTLQFPTGETAMKIEGLAGGGNENFLHYEDSRALENSDIAIGQKFNDQRNGNNYIITQKTGEDTFKALQLTSDAPQILNEYQYDVDQKEYNNVLKQYIKENKNLSENFSNAVAVDTNNAIYKYYENDVQKFLKRIRPDLQIVTDSKGVKWFETKITPQDSGDVVAFQKQTTSTKDAVVPGQRDLQGAYNPSKDLVRIEKYLTKRFGKDAPRLFNVLDNVLKREPTAVAYYLKGMINLSDRIDNMTITHETGHFIELFATEQERQMIQDIYGKPGDVMEDQRERFAEASRDYQESIGKGYGQSRKDKARGIIQRIIDRIKAIFGKLSPERKFWNKLDKELNIREPRLPREKWITNVEAARESTETPLFQKEKPVVKPKPEDQPTRQSAKPNKGGVGNLKISPDNVETVLEPIKPPSNLSSGDYNTDHIKIDDVSKEQLDIAVEDLRPQFENLLGKKLSNDEIIKLANNTNSILNKTVKRDETAAAIAANLKLRERIAMAASQGKLDSDFVKDVLMDKAAGANIARQLNARRIDAEPKEATLIDTMLDSIMKTGVESDKVIEASKKYDLSKFEDQVKLYREFVKPKVEDWLDLLRYNSMLSSPNTHVVNTASNWQGTGLIAPLQKAIEGGLDFTRATITRKDRTRFAGEFAPYLVGYYSNVNNGIRAFTKVMKGQAANGNLDMKIIPLTTKDQKVLSKVEGTLNVVTRLLEGMDQFFTTMTSSGVESALQYRQQKGVKVPLATIQAKNETKYRLFRNELMVKDEGTLLNAIGYLANQVNTLRKAENPLVRTTAKLTFPFLVTPTNISKQAVEFTPLGVGTLPKSADKTAQLAKMIIGASVVAMAAMLLGANRMTWGEPKDEKQKKAFRAAGLQPYSVKIGNNWVNYSRLHPALAFNLAILAAVYDSQKNGKLKEDAGTQILTALANVSQFYADATFLKNMSDIIDTTQGNISAPVKLVSNYATQFIPFRALAGWANRFVDDVQRTVSPDANVLQQQLQYVMMQIPFLSSKLPARTGPSGEPIKNTNVLLNAFTPNKVTTEDPDFKQLFDVGKVASESQKGKTNEEIGKAIKDGDNQKAKDIASKYNTELRIEINKIRGPKNLTKASQKIFDDALIDLTDKSINSRKKYQERKDAEAKGEVYKSDAPDKKTKETTSKATSKTTGSGRATGPGSRGGKTTSGKTKRLSRVKSVKIGKVGRIGSLKSPAFKKQKRIKFKPV